MRAVGIPSGLMVNVCKGGACDICCGGWDMAVRGIPGASTSDGWARERGEGERERRYRVWVERGRNNVISADFLSGGRC